MVGGKMMLFAEMSDTLKRPVKRDLTAFRKGSYGVNNGIHGPASLRAQHVRGQGLERVMTHILALHQENDLFSDVLGMIANPL